VSDDLLLSLETMFLAQADAERAAGASAYMRDQFTFYGIPAPAQRAIAREATAGHAAPSEQQLVRTVRACWRKPQREWQYFACGYLRRHVKGRSAALLRSVAPLITSKSWWDTVDTLAGHTVGGLVSQHPELTATLDEWIGSDNIWLARTAILHQLGYKSRTDADRLFAYCTKRAGDREFFLRKAIGWALREYSKTDEKAVRTFVRRNANVLSPLSRREALKWLDRRA
jgi:3-methyladenine DNA glycosylase AlkD